MSNIFTFSKKFCFSSSPMLFFVAIPREKGRVIGAAAAEPYDSDS
jgi:hypothetical protein